LDFFFLGSFYFSASFGGSSLTPLLSLGYLSLVRFDKGSGALELDFFDKDSGAAGFPFTNGSKSFRL
jgi:hypothetical protein